jgi:hypothetical protein
MVVAVVVAQVRRAHQPGGAHADAPRDGAAANASDGGLVAAAA